MIYLGIDFELRLRMYFRLKLDIRKVKIEDILEAKINDTLEANIKGLLETSVKDILEIKIKDQPLEVGRCDFFDIFPFQSSAN